MIFGAVFEKMILGAAAYNDDCAFDSSQGVKSPTIINKFVEASHLFGLTISQGKTEVLF